MKKLFAITGAFLIFRFASSQIKWDGGGGDGLWNTSTNWSGNVVPGAGDNVLLDNSIVSGSYFVNLPGGVFPVTINSLTITPTGINSITLLNPFSNTSPVAFTATGAGDAIVLNNGAILKNSSGASSGTPVSVTVGNFRINNGGRYIHNCARAHTTLAASLSIAAGTENGTFEFDVPGAAFAFSFSNRIYGNLEFSSTAHGNPVIYIASGSSVATVNGNLIINPDVTVTLDFTNDIIIKGNLIQSASSAFNISNSTANTPVKIKGNIFSQGLITESGTGSGLIELNGSTNQNVSITGAITNNVGFAMNNTAGATLSSPVTLPYRLQLINGKIKTSSTNTLTLMDNVTYTGGSPVSFIEGPVKKIGDDNFYFPIGVGSMYAPFGISGSGGVVTDEFTVEYKRINPQSVHGTNYQNPLDHISYVEHWTLTRNAGTSSKSITLTAHQYSFAKVLNTLLVSRYYPGDMQWKNEGGTNFNPGPDFPPYISGTLTTVSSLSVFGDFTLATTDPFAVNPLPIQLISFNAVKIGRGALLKWELSSYCSKETTFELLKSKNSRSFTAIAVIQGKESSQFYNYTDDHLAAGTTYYRLKISGEHGYVSYSRIIDVINGNEEITLISMMPSLVNNTASISITCKVNTQIDMFVIDMLGRKMNRQRHRLLKGNNTISISCENLPGGSYILSGQTDAGTTNAIRFIKQ